MFLPSFGSLRRAVGALLMVVALLSLVCSGFCVMVTFGLFLGLLALLLFSLILLIGWSMFSRTELEKSIGVWLLFAMVELMLPLLFLSVLYKVLTLILLAVIVPLLFFYFRRYKSKYGKREEGGNLSKAR